MGEPKPSIRPDPVLVLRVTVRAPDLDGFITRYSRHIAGDRIFIFSKNPQPPGTQVRFTLQLASGEALIGGRGTVKRMQLDTGDAHRPPGMEVQFQPLDERSQTLLEFMRATRAGAAKEVVVAPVARAIEPALPTPLPPPPSLPPSPSSVSLPPSPLSASAPSPPSLPPSPLSASSSSLSSLLPPPPPAPPAEEAAPPSPTSRPSPLGKSSLPLPLPPLKPVLPAKPVLPPSLSLEVGWKVAEATVPGADPPTHVEAPPADPNAISAPLLTDLAKAEVAAHDAERESQDESQLGGEPPTAVGPAPAMAEAWRDPAAATSANGEVPANPFSEISDGAIEYFVEWSLEQSIGPRSLAQARFSDVPMLLPGQTGAHDALDDEIGPLARRQRLVVQGAIFAAGLLLGALVVALLMHRPTTAPRTAALSPPAAGPVAPPAAPEALPAPSRAAPEAELSVVSRPSAATVVVDGEAAGTTPLSTKLSPGRHDVVVQKDRYASHTESVELPAQLRVELRRPSAILHVRSTPSAAEVTVAGEVRGRTPVDIKLPGFESYDVRLTLAGAKPWRKKVYLGRLSNNVEVTLSKPAPPKGPVKR